MGFYLYKGLKKPLVLFGLKDRYIFYAMGSAVLGLISAVVLSHFIGLFGLAIGFGIGGLLIWYIFHLQDTKGLYLKTRNDNEILIVKPRTRKSRK